MRQAVIALFISVGAAGAGCGNGSSPDQAMVRDQSMAPADQSPSPADGGAGVDLGCYLSPTTHLQILNACTTAEQFDKTAVTPLLHADGTLPPLP
jgi:hypothetical protein